MTFNICRLLVLMVFVSAMATNDTDFMGALDPHSFAEGGQPSNSNHGSRFLDQNNLTMYDAVSLVDVWQPGEQHPHFRKHKGI